MYICINNTSKVWILSSQYDYPMSVIFLLINISINKTESNLQIFFFAKKFKPYYT